MRIVFFEIQGWEKPILKKALGKAHELTFFSEAIDDVDIKAYQDAEVISGFIYSPIPGKLIKQLKQLKLITTRSTGYDHIDLKVATQQGVTVCTVPFYGENTVAEHTFALILALSRNVHKSYLRTVRSDFSIDGLKGFDLKGKTLGVIGTGHIGLHVIRMAKGFGMHVKAFDVKQDNFIAEVLHFDYAPFQEVLAEADILTLHAPENPHTHHMINRETIYQIKKGALLINTSRGGLIETEALIKALDDGHLRGAGLDVMEGEALIKEEKQLLYDRSNPESMQQLVQDHILINHENVVFTPHIAFYSEEALQRIIESTAENILRFAEDNPVNVVGK